jgi:hypothetical protein
MPFPEEVHLPARIQAEGIFETFRLRLAQKYLGLDLSQLPFPRMLP